MGFINLLYKKFKYDRHLSYSRNEIEKLQRKKLINLAKYAYENSKFYKKLFKSEGITYKELDNINIKDLPKTNKQLLMENFNEVITVDDINKKDVINFIDKYQNPTKLLHDKYYVIHSSGTTGEIGYYIYTKNNWELLKAVGASRLFDSFGINRKTYAFIGAVDGHYAGISFFLSPVNKFEEYFYEDFIVIDINKPLENYINKLNSLQPDVISGYPSAMGLLINYQKKGELEISPKTVICGGEPLSKETVIKIKKYWKTTPKNYYGTSESILMGIGTGNQEMYIFDDLILLEIIDDGILLTNLYNYTEPLIRYKLDDLVVKSEKKEKKYPFTIIKSISGREEDLLWLRNNKGDLDFIHPIVFVELHVKGLKKFQILKRNEVNIQIKIVKTDDTKADCLKERMAKKVSTILKKKNMNNVELSIKVVKNIENDPDSGKFRLIKRKN